MISPLGDGASPITDGQDWRSYALRPLARGIVVGNVHDSHAIGNGVGRAIAGADGRGAGTCDKCGNARGIIGVGNGRGGNVHNVRGRLALR
uniref:Uncharacterized protein n=1 Tax=Panagrolaimus sp. ES5 TaxID=591445 RepID=A0AC34FPL0_9BILA